MFGEIKKIMKIVFGMESWRVKGKKWCLFFVFKFIVEGFREIIIGGYSGLA